MRPAATKRAGWTLLELLLVATLALFVLGKAAFVMRYGLDTASDEVTDMYLDDSAQRVIDQIALAIMGSDRGTLLPTIEDVHSTGIRYRFSLGIENGVAVWSEQEEIELEGGSQVVWRESPDEAEERRVVWTNLTRPFLEGEVLNGVDDNGNGLVDENGLSFVLDGDSVLIRLSLQRVDEDGRTVIRSAQARVTCRN